MRLMISPLRHRKWPREYRKLQKITPKFLKCVHMITWTKCFFDMQAKMDDLNLKYFGEMYANLEKSFEDINGVLQGNRDEIKEMAYMTQNGQDGVFVRREDEDE